MFAAHATLLTPPSGVVKASYSDDFNRADTSTLGANWTNRVTAGGQFKIVSNTAQPTAKDAWALSSYVSTMNTNDVKATCTVGTVGAVGSFAYLNLYIRSNASNQIWGWAYNGSQWRIHSATGTYTASTGTSTQRAISGGTLNYVAGDVITFEATGNVYLLKQNGTTRVTFTDSTSLYPFVDASHREVAIGSFVSSSSTPFSTFDSWSAIDL
jgi:hypothetical protein